MLTSTMVIDSNMRYPIIPSFWMQHHRSNGTAVTHQKYVAEICWWVKDGEKMMQGQVFGFQPSRVLKCGQHKDHSWLFAGTHGVHIFFMHFKTRFWLWILSPKKDRKVICSPFSIFYSKLLATTRCSSVLNQEPQICECPRTKMSWTAPSLVTSRSWVVHMGRWPLLWGFTDLVADSRWFLWRVLGDPMFWVKWEVDGKCRIVHGLQSRFPGNMHPEYLQHQISGACGVSHAPIWNAWAYSENGGNLHTLVNSWWKSPVWAVCAVFHRLPSVNIYITMEIILFDRQIIWFEPWQSPSVSQPSPRDTSDV